MYIILREKSRRLRRKVLAGKAMLAFYKSKLITANGKAEHVDIDGYITEHNHDNLNCFVMVFEKFNQHLPEVAKKIPYGENLKPVKFVPGENNIRGFLLNPLPTEFNLINVSML